MRTYRLSGMTEGCGGRIARAIRSRIGGDINVEADSAAGTVRVDSSADPQIVAFAIEGEGFPVTSVDASGLK